MALHGSHVTIKNSLDGRPAFEKYCRRPGTRCNGIMELIDHGYTDEEIAEAVSKLPSRARGQNPNVGCDAVTISVYRKAHDNKLCKLAVYTNNRVDEQRDKLIWAMHDNGMKPVKIAGELGVSVDIVRYALKRKAARVEVTGGR